ncbi:uncharacterized protein FOMMEDRAFT_161497 [Fomitiporia mediterranea MF3/22]|uniref:uncharacterized protein n=1 Tax=Fomitiporia mediterranea (strain MF3/22) TaxID=694068 RepID=UPI00044078A0|nr:uncharacterized protein FOMMEDRAFT_161497 [Fomitiporia mediterranea MF3/22]EJC98666.1 hypothetical protein FOMMEDRAFT_161497 [Fomitiporia mediterranea MF3/22]
MENQGHSRRDSSPRPKDHQNHQRTGSHAREQPVRHSSNHEKGGHMQVAAASGDRSSSPLKQENGTRDKIVQTIQSCLDVAVVFSPELFETLLASLIKGRKEAEDQFNAKIQRCNDMKKSAEEDKTNIQKSRKMLERRKNRNENAEKFIRMLYETSKIVESAEKRYKELDDLIGMVGFAHNNFNQLFKKAKEDIQAIQDSYGTASNTQK